MPPLDAPAEPVLDRRDALRLLAAGMAASLAGCGKPEEEIVPYVRMPERIVPGEPLRFATALPLSGYGRGVLVTTVDGRPIKVEGNPRHPASGGATDVFAEADVLGLWDPHRSRTVLENGRIAGREAYRAALRPEIERLEATGGAGLRILTGRVASPTLARQLDALLTRFPAARWHVHEPLGDGQAQTGARLAYGRPLVALPRLEDARTILAVGADPLGPGPDSIRLARGFAKARRPGPEMARLYALEAAPTLTGAKADHRLALPPAALAEAVLAVANALGAALRPARLPAEAETLLAVAAAELARGGGLLLAGEALPPGAQALAAWINGRIGAPLDLREPADRVGSRDPGSLAELAAGLDGGGVAVLLVLGSNPAYDGPGGLDLPALFAKAPFRVHAGPYRDETARLCTWHLPVSHPLESWSDLSSVDGTVTLLQPLIRPLGATTTLHEVLAELSGEPDATAYALVRETWRERWQGTGRERPGGDFEAWWREALHAGVVPGTGGAPAAGLAAALPAPDALPLGAPPSRPAGNRLDVLLAPDPSVWDGSYAGNAWLQELPKPLSKEVWGNALALGPGDAERLGIREGDVVRVTADGRGLEVPVRVEPGHAPGCGTLALGYGRREIGPVGSGIGTNAFPLRTFAEPWLARGASVAATGRRQPVLTTSHVVRDRALAGENLPVLALAALRSGDAPALGTGPLPTLYPEEVRPVDGSEHAWGMVIDAAACIGCNACMVACQAENNVPVVGPEEVARGRSMHWLRVDVYDHGAPAAPRPGFQPVPCMHCEHAPCEPVCPVAASVHDSEGLNVQVYNRCVGTRFCEANCPYKVRRFNFFGYADGQAYADLGLESYRAGRNPDVTVRARGVMEKCTYCVQRISRARRAALRDGRPMGPDEVTTACQNACPTRAIHFGDLKQPADAATVLKGDPRHYALLGHLGTRPRTTYLAEVKNPSPDLPEGGA